jgi:hypothetical protein
VTRRESKLDPLDADLARLIEFDTTDSQMPARVRTRLRRRIELAITGVSVASAPTDTPAPDVPAPATAASSSPAALNGILVPKVLVLCGASLVLGGIVGAGICAKLLGRAAPRPPTVARAPDGALHGAAPDSGAVDLRGEAGRPPRQAQQQARRASSRPLRQKVRSRGALQDQALARERSLIEVARTALTRNDAAAALRALRTHARQFPHGRLTEERESLAVQALVSVGEHAAARRRGSRFKRQYPTSLLLPVVENALRSIP